MTACSQWLSNQYWATLITLLRFRLLPHSLAVYTSLKPEIRASLSTSFQSLYAFYWQHMLVSPVASECHFVTAISWFLNVRCVDYSLISASQQTKSLDFYWEGPTFQIKIESFGPVTEKHSLYNIQVMTLVTLISNGQLCHTSFASVTKESLVTHSQLQNAGMY